MHVLIITDSYPNAYLPMQGVFVSDQARALAASGIQMGVIACVPISLLDISRSGLKKLKVEVLESGGVHETIRCFMQIPRWYFYPIHRIAQLGLPLIRDYIEKHGIPDLIHVHGFHSGKLAMCVREKYHIPIVVTEHNSRFLSNTLDRKRKKFAVEFYRRADARIAVSNTFRDCLQLASSVPFEVLPNAVDVNAFQPGNRSRKFVFLSAGRFDSNKNQLLQINAFARVAAEIPDSELWLAGDGEMLSQCEAHANSKSLTHRVRFLGYLSREQLIDAMQQSSVFLISSNHETFGVVAIEAMSCGLYVISTPCGGTEDTVRGLGRLTDGSEAEFASAMLDAYFKQDAETAGKLRAAMVARYSYEAVASALTQLYSQLLQARS